MTPDPDVSAAFSFSVQVYGLYDQLMRAAGEAGQDDLNHEPRLGGNLLYAGELDEQGRALVVAGNVAGCASLAATADPATQKQAIRDGVVDFLVTTLDEALRILKNEIRKGETVAVCVGAAAEAVKREMQERGVLADLQRPREVSFANSSGSQTEMSLDSVAEDPMRIPALVRWSVATAPGLWLPKLDAIALDCLEPGAWPARRWLRLAPRYLGRLAQGVRLLRADRKFGAKFVEQVREKTERGEIRVPVEIQSSYRGASEEHHFSPPGYAKSAR
ncbi:MAG: hypothetical protein WCA11_16420 [Terracidiphilus sp.]